MASNLKSLYKLVRSAAHNTVNGYSSDADTIIQAMASIPLEAPFVDADPSIAIPVLESLLLLCGPTQDVPPNPMTIAAEAEAALPVTKDGVGPSVAQTTDDSGAAVISSEALVTVESLSLIPI